MKLTLIKEKAQKLSEFILTSNKSAKKHGVKFYAAYIKEHELIEYKCHYKMIVIGKETLPHGRPQIRF